MWHFISFANYFMKNNFFINFRNHPTLQIFRFEAAVVEKSLKVWKPFS